MKKLSRLQSAIFSLGGILLIIGAIIYKFEPVIVAPAIFSTGALFYVIMQWLQSYEGNNTTIIRLRKIQVLSGVMILFSAVLMIANRWVYDIYAFTKIDIYNSWIAFLMVGAVLQVYTVFRMDNELKKQK